MRERNLGGIAGERKHRFTEDHVPKADAVEPAGELSVDPGLDAVRLPRAVPAFIRNHHLRGDPGAGLVVGALARAGAHDVRERRIHPHHGREVATLVSPCNLPQPLAQAVRWMKIFHAQHHARIR